MKHVIQIDDKKVFIRKYKIRLTGREGSTLQTSIPREVFEREARRLGLSYKEALAKLRAVWRFNDFAGLYLNFEPVQENRAVEKHE